MQWSRVQHPSLTADRCREPMPCCHRFVAAVRLREPGARPGNTRRRTLRAAAVPTRHLGIIATPSPARRSGRVTDPAPMGASPGRAPGSRRSHAAVIQVHSSAPRSRCSACRSHAGGAHSVGGGALGHLRGGQLGVWFRRQVVVGRFVADFAAASVKLVVEVDGTAHARRAAADARRDRALARLGWRVVRLPAALVLRQPLAAVGLVRLALSR